MIKRLKCIMLGLVISGNLSAQEKVSIEQFSWLTGHWIGEGLGGQVEEIWSTPRGGSMVGVFRLMTNNENKLYELFSIYEDGNDIRFRLKHFSPNMKGWEEKDDFLEFQFVSIDETTADFGGIKYQLLAPDSIKVTAYFSEDKSKKELIFLGKVGHPSDNNLQTKK